MARLREPGKKDVSGCEYITTICVMQGLFRFSAVFGRAVSAVFMDCPRVRHCGGG
jgi:hypothetical protein